MQLNMPNIVSVLLLALARCPCSASTGTFLGHIQPSGDALTDEQDAAAIERVEGEARLAMTDGAAMAATAKIEETRSQAEQRDGSEMEQDSDAIKMVAYQEYARRMVHATRELKSWPEDEAAAEHAAKIQQSEAMRDAWSLHASAVAMERDATRARLQATEEIRDARAAAKAGNLTLAQERADVGALEAAARREGGRARAEEERGDAGRLRAAASAEQRAASEERSAAADELRDADAVKRAAMFSYLHRIQRAHRELEGRQGDLEVAEKAAEVVEKKELADAHAMTEVAHSLQGDAEATIADSKQVSADASAIEGVALMSKSGHK